MPAVKFYPKSYFQEADVNTKKSHLSLSLFIAIAMLIFSLACSNSAATPQLVATAPAENAATERTGNVDAADPTEETTAEAPTEAPATEAAPTGSDSYKMGDIIQIDNSVLVVLGWDFLEPTEYTTPEAGKKFIGVDVLLVNGGSEPVGISSDLQMTLKDETGQKYEADFSAATLSTKNDPGGSLLPGEMVRGVVGYQVAENFSNLEFVFDADTFGSGKVFVNLGNAPAQLEAPTDIPGQKEQQIFKIGEAVTMGDWIITINEVKPLEGDSFNTPPEGYQFIALDVTIENKSAEARTVSTMLQMELKDLTTGWKYQETFGAIGALSEDGPDGELAAGEKIRGSVAYEVPTGAQGLVLVFSPELFDYAKIFISLDK